MLILGTTADDKGAQLEALVHATLAADGYQRIRRNEIREGGNELDVVAERVSPLMGDAQITQVICEAKAYADPVSSPNWHRFLGKVLIARSENPSAVGVLIALNGVNGNVIGSYNSLRRRDSAILIIDGATLETRARQSGELLEEAHAKSAITELYRRVPARLESTYYGGAWRWLARWGTEEYSIVGGRGELLSVDSVESLRPALEASAGGRLVTAADAQAAAEARHDLRMEVFNKLFYGLPVPLSAGDPDAIISGLSAEPFCEVTGTNVSIQDSATLGATAICRLFTALFENIVQVEQLAFIADGLLEPYVNRLIDVLPEVHPGVTLDEPGEQTLRAVAPLFPSIWLLLAKPIEFITAHANSRAAHPGVLALDRNAFWESVTSAIEADFANPALRGFLFDHINVVELEEDRSMTVKSRSGVVATIEVKARTSIGQLSDDLIGEAGTRHMLVRVLPGMNEPWESSGFPDPVIRLRRPLGPGRR